MIPTMTRLDTMRFIELPCFNGAWFARKLYGEEKKDVTNFHSKLKRGSFSDEEINGLNLISKELLELLNHKIVKQ